MQAIIMISLDWMLISTFCILSTSVLPILTKSVSVSTQTDIDSIPSTTVNVPSYRDTGSLKQQHVGKRKMYRAILQCSQLLGTYQCHQEPMAVWVRVLMKYLMRH